MVGAVKKEGVYELPVAQSTLLDALVAAGNLAEDADSKIEIHRASHPQTMPRGLLFGSQPQLGTVRAAYHQEPLPSQEPKVETVVVDLATASDLAAQNCRLEDGDVIVVPRRPGRAVYVLGPGQSPGESRSSA